MSGPAPASAQPANAFIDFNQSAQPLGAALKTFARTSGVEIVFDETILGRRLAPALRGRMTSSEALRRLLLGSGFIAANGRAGGLIIKAAAPVQSLPPQPPDLAEIVVTARKREERAIDVPMAVTAVSGSQLEQRGSRSLADFLQEAPGVGIYNNGKGQQNIQIRGVSTSLGANANGFYLDELPFTGVTQPVNPDLNVWDLDHVEVLRGPQEVLFGEGSMGGTVRILTKDADLTNWEFKGSGFGSDTEGGGGNGGVKGAFNAPIIPGILAVRIAATHEHYSGWLDNSDTGLKNVNDETDDTFRVKVRFDPTDRLSIDGSYWYSNSNYPGGGSAARDDGQQSRSSGSLASAVQFKLYGLVARYDVGGAELFYSYAQIKSALPQDGISRGSPLLGGTDLDAQSQELRITSKDGGALRWTVGGYLRDSQRNDLFDFALFDINSVTRTTSNTYAVFGEATYTLPSAPIDLSAGLRSFHDRLNAVEDDSGVTTDNSSGTFHSLNPHFSVAWRPQPDMTVYVSVAKGFRSGQIQSATTNALGAPFGLTFPTRLKPDSIWTYELGAKADLLNRQLALEGSVFYSDWKNLPVREPISTTGLNGFINSDGARIKGIELDLVARLLAGFTLSASGAYIDATYAGTVPGTGIFDGAPVDDVAKFTANISAGYRTQLASGIEGFAHASWQHNSPRTAASFSTYLPGDTIDRVDARLGIDFWQFTVALFAENLTNDNGATGFRTVSSLTATTNDITAPRLRPRTVGVEVSFRFGR